SVDIAQVGAVPLLVGCIVAFLSGVFAIRFLVAMLRRGRFYQFAPYCLAIGLFTLAYALWQGLRSTTSPPQSWRGAGACRSAACFARSLRVSMPFTTSARRGRRAERL